MCTSVLTALQRALSAANGMAHLLKAAHADKA